MAAITTLITLTAFPMADLYLIVGKSQDSLPLKAFGVNRHCLCIASRVFAAKLLGDPMGVSVTEIDLADDNPEAMEVIVRIIHMKGSTVAKDKLTVELMTEVAILADKYDVLALVRPFVWPRLWSIDLDSLTNNQLTKFISICWYFKSRTLFDVGMSKLVRNVSVNLNGEVEYKGHIIDSLDLPGSIFDQLIAFRHKILEKFYELCHRLVDDLMDGEINPCMKSTNRHECNAMLFGILAMQFSRLGLLPPRTKNGETYRRSIHRVKRSLRAYDPSKFVLDGHDDCANNINLFELHKVLMFDRVELTADQSKHFDGVEEVWIPSPVAGGTKFLCHYDDSQESA